MKAFFRYRLLDNLKSLAVLIVVLIAVPLLLSITLAGSSSTMNGTGSLVGSIWALVIGIVVLRGDLRLGNQFGLSRRSAFWGSVLSCTAAFAAASAVLSLLTAILQMIYRGGDRIEVMDLYQILYGDSTVGVMPAWDYVQMACMLFALCVCFGFFGMLCTMAFWRLNKLGKWILGVSMGFVSMELFLGVGMPNMDRLSWLLRLAHILATNVWALIAFLLAWAAVFLLGAWLLARRAVIKPAAK